MPNNFRIISGVKFLACYPKEGGKALSTTTTTCVQVVQAQKITTTTYIFEPLRMLEALVCIVEKDKMNRQKILKHN